MTRLSPRAAAVRPSPTLTLAARAKELARQGKPVLSLAAGEPDFDTPPGPKRAAIAAIEEGFTKYTEVPGIPELRKAVAEDLNRRWKTAYEPAQVVVSCGAKHSLFNLLMALAGDGDEVIAPAPYWVSYPDMARLCGARFVAAPTEEPNNFHLDIQAIERAITPRTRVLILNSPNNPTGAVYARSELAEAVALCRKRGVFVLSDEIYEKLVYPGPGSSPRPFASAASLGADLADSFAVVSGVSKTYAMTGWRIGWAAGPKDLMKASADIQSQTTSNPASISQKAALAALNEPDPAWEREMLERFAARRDLVQSRLDRIPGVECMEPEGAFYAFPRVGGWFGRTVGGIEIKNSDDFARVCLERAHVALMPGSAFGADGYIRLSYAASEKVLEEAMERLARLFSSF